MPFVTLDQITPDEVRWLWRLAYGHLAILDGDPGLGKSLVTLDLCARITTGREFPDGTPGVAPASVVVINGEDGARNVLPGRLRAAGADMSRVCAFDHTPGEEFLRLPGHLARLEEVVARSQAKYVVLDPIMSFLDRNVNVAHDHSVRAALAPLADLAARHQCVIQMVRHLNKGTGVNPLYRGLYSIGFIACARVAWLVAADPQIARQYVLAQAKNNYDSPQPSLAYGIEATESGRPRIAWRGVKNVSERELLAAAPSRLQRRMRAQDFLLEFLRDGPRTTRQIWDAAKLLPFSVSTLSRARKLLEIRSIRVHAFMPQQAYYWLLPGQKLPPGIDDNASALESLHEHLNKYNPDSTPLDDDAAN